MLSARFKPWHVPLFAAKYAYLHLRRFPVLVHFEVTMRCNAHCDFCDYWKNGADAAHSDAESYAEAARYFNPLMITFTGGEPLPVSYTHLRAHETGRNLVCRLLLEK